MDLICFYMDILAVQGISAQITKGHHDGLKAFDKGLRASLYSDGGERAADFAAHLARSCGENTVVIAEDPFQVSYLAMWIPPQHRYTREGNVLLAGPLLFEAYDNERIREILLNNQVPHRFLAEATEYYYGLPVVWDRRLWDSQWLVLANRLFGQGCFQVLRTAGVPGAPTPPPDFRLEADTILTMEFIEERYELEDEMLRAVVSGNTQRALELQAAMRGHRLQPRSKDTLRDMKNIMISLNTLLRKAVQSADVHPFYLDSTSAAFAREIEVSISINALRRLTDAMIRKYCMLVKNHSLRGYSRLIQQAINTMDFNLEEPLSLGLLAKLLSVNPSYLSARFKKETGATITDTINQKRLDHSLLLLNTTDLPVRDIADRSGFGDVNYFTRLFRRQYGRPPRAYREEIRSGCKPGLS